MCDNRGFLGFGNDNSCLWIILIIALVVFCGCGCND